MKNDRKSEMTYLFLGELCCFSVQSGPLSDCCFGQLFSFLFIYFYFIFHLSCWVAVGLAGAYVLCLFGPLVCFLIVKCFESLKALCKFPIIIIMFHEYACTDRYHIAWVFSWEQMCRSILIYIYIYIMWLADTRWCANWYSIVFPTQTT